MSIYRNLGGVALAAFCLVSLPIATSLAQDAEQESEAVQEDGDAAELSPITFTAPQAIGGGGNYARSCASCHGAELEGSAGPALSGANFSWLDRSVADLHAYIQDLMPADAPGSLSDAQVSTIIAFMAQKQGMEAGDEPISTDPADLESVRFGQ
ncbi:c-type cytochrome [Pelagibacterium luteolum]|uniref:Cytochrome C oxidase, cbb3-type, subunit III n=1 Tax=Pelagibacterium luteolum TaxID=440168 RepID=A0A1G7SWS3_9HYPH|nr:cytochrome c [Pelagibacterium luteolum]SDG26879.1 Cytochrome C oxidase, cbb3-type, subunit III [Pelagibacterium luteolum]